MNRLLPIALLAAACTPIIESPTPSLEQLTPALVCNDQFVTTVTVDGSQMTPVPKGVLTDDPVLDIPALWLERVLALDGASAEATTQQLDATTRWLSNDVMEFDVAPELFEVTVGVHDIFVRNLDGQIATTGQAIAAAPPPIVEAITPNLLCLDQSAEDAVITGDEFLDVTGTLPVVTVGPIALDVTAMTDCFDLAGPVSGRSCDTADITFPQDSLDPGVYDITLTNPETAQCASVEELKIEIVPAPILTSFVPDLTCIDQADRVYTLTGENFLRLADGTLPNVNIGTYNALADSAQTCTPLTGPAGGDLCTELTFTLPQDQLPPAVYTIVVTNPPPADCFTTEPIQVEIVPQPTVTEIEPTDYASNDPEGTCLTQGARTFDLTGTGFIELADGTPPIVAVGGYVVPAVDTVPSACTALLGPAGGNSCTVLSITLPTDAVNVAVHDVDVTNPAPADCYAEEAIVLETFPEPTLTSIDAQLVCGNQPTNTFTVTGSDMYVVGGAYPAVNIGTYTAVADSGTCTSWAGPGADSVCTELFLTVNSGDLGTGLLPVSIDNPAPLGCTSTDTVDIEVVGAPIVTTMTPPGACDINEDVVVSIAGSGFLDLGTGQVPAVTFDTNTDITPVSLGACNGSLGGTISGLVCDTLGFTLPAGTASANGDYDITITNPSPADCGVTTVFSYSDPPVITSTDPPQVCLDPTSGFVIEVYGNNFTVNSQIVIGTVSVPTTFVDAGHVTGNVPVGALSPGLYDITVDNGGGTCVDTAMGVLEITELPILFFVDPEVVPNVIPVTATAYVSGINDTVTDVTIIEVATSVVTPGLPFRWDAGEPAVIEFDLPASLPAGYYDLIVSDATGCQPELLDAFYVESVYAENVVSIEPAYGWDQDVTPVTISSDGTPPFLDTPRVYFSPVTPGPTATADELRAVTYVDGDTTDAVVPAGLGVDTYDVIIVNPVTGEVMIDFGGFEVLSNEPPRIDVITPGTIPTSVTSVLLTGGGFGNPSTDPDPVVELECYNPTGDDCNGVGGGTYSNFTIAPTAITAWDANSITMNVDGGTVSDNVCTIKVTKTTDDTVARFAALSVTAPSANLYQWRRTEELTTPRQQLMSTAGRATRTSRYLYAIGGDDGTQLLDTIERARVDQFGDLDPWVVLPHKLPTPLRSAATIKIGRFIYLLGGVDSSGPTTSVYRAQILDPLAAPSFTTNLSVTLDPVGLGAGAYIYKVAALFDSAYDDNPNGESLPSDPFIVRLPSLAPDKLQLTLEWTEVDGAAGYRIYRRDIATGGFQWLTDEMNGQTDTTFTDLGDPTTAPGPTVPAPLPTASLGEWATLPPLSPALAPTDAPREAPCAGWGHDPSAPNTAYIFVAGGHNGTTARADIEYLDISLVDEYDHEVGSWTTSTQALSGARYECGAFSVTSELHSRIDPSDDFIYFGGGNGDTATDVGAIKAGGDFDPARWYPNVKGPTGSGYGFAAASNTLYEVGGEGPLSTSKSGKICGIDLACGGGPPDPPDVQNWNGIGKNLCDPRAYPGSAQESSVIFMIGGNTGAAPTKTVDFTNY